MRLVGTVKRILWHRYYGTGNNYMFEFQVDDSEQTYTVSGAFGKLVKGEHMILEVEPTNNGVYNVVHGGFTIEYNMFSLYKIITTVDGIGEKKGNDIINQIQAARIARNAPLTTNLLSDFVEDIYSLNLPDKQKESIVSVIYKFQIMDELYYIFGQSLELKNAINMADYIISHDMQNAISENPYRLVDIDPTINIHQLDAYVMHEFNIDKTNPDRVTAYVKSSMYHYLNEYKLGIINKEQIIRSCSKYAQVPSYVVGKAIDNMCVSGELIKFEDNTYMLSRYYEIEKNIATKLAKLLTTPIDEFIPAEVDFHITTNYANSGYYSDEQIEAMKAAFTNRVSIITGGAGTGKSTVIKAIYELAKSLHLDPIAIAPTGKAADRLNELGGRTIHYSIGWDGLQARQQLTGQFYIIDEASMIDLDILNEFMKSIPDKCFIVFVGDPFQLPAVNAGAPFQTLIESGLIKTTMLTKVFRQAEGKLLQLAYAINNRNIGEVLRILSSNSPEVAKLPVQSDNIVDVIKYIIDKLDNKTVILVPTRRQRVSKISTETINGIGIKMITQKFKADPHRPQVTKCICTENDYSRGVFNGQIGFVQHAQSTEQLTKVAFGDKICEYNQIEYAKYIEPAYALTVHKAQGSEFNEPVFISFVSEHASMWNKQLLYTAVTRAKKHVCFITDVNFEHMLQNALLKRDTKPTSYIPYYLALLLKKEASQIVSYLQDT